MRRCCYLFMKKEQKQEKKTKPLFYSMSSQNHFDAEKVHLDTSDEANPNVNHILHSLFKWTKYTQHRQQQQIWKGSKSNSIAVFVRLKNLIKVLDKIVRQSQCQNAEYLIGIRANLMPKICCLTQWGCAIEQLNRVDSFVFLHKCEFYRFELNSDLCLITLNCNKLWISTVRSSSFDILHKFQPLSTLQSTRMNVFNFERKEMPEEEHILQLNVSEGNISEQPLGSKT